MNRRSGDHGFTLLELIVVLAILSLLAAMVIPRLPSTESGRLKGSAKSVAAALRYMGEQSVTAKTAFRLHLNLAEHSITVTRRLANGDETVPDDPFFRQKLLAEGVQLADVQTERLGTVKEGEVLVDFGARGLAEFLTIHLQTTAGAAYTVAGFPSSGKVKVLAGYQDVTL